MTSAGLWLGRRLAYIGLAVLGAGLALFAYTTIGDTAITPGLLTASGARSSL